MARRAERNQGMEDGFKQELRFELLFDIACGIGSLAMSELRTGGESYEDLEYGSRVRRSTSLCLQSDFQEPEARSVSFLRTQSKEDTVTPLAGLLARTTSEPFAISRHASRASTEVLSSGPRYGDDLQSTCRRCFTRSVDGERIHHYAADDFHLIRTAFGISEVDYAKAFPSELTESQPQWREKLKESVSEGASGSFFYRVTCNDGVCKSRYIVKQVTAEEKNTMMRILPAYREYATCRNGRTLIQYFGCHSVTLR
eukprot:CAMPEP_0169368308 /NCGR_PEP_ID=MMETSP1017-20121227/34169_1 /TAXON_ID=342587 /ORGANISM="Karlodinium micrum, Strain CCMP2283" /LENGTH=255 /DNA_ID=CAMNT_0009466479 /DNA_START=409 /DNA_END=1172 /DNA_ORIENTATION=-